MMLLERESTKSWNARERMPTHLGTLLILYDLDSFQLKDVFKSLLFRFQAESSGEESLWDLL
jgi:hypothetical protein